MQRACDSCSVMYEAIRPSSRYCSARCRGRAARAGTSKPRTPSEAPTPSTSTVVADQVRRELGHLIDSAAGQMALSLALRLDAAVDTGSAMAAVARELRSILTEMLGLAIDAADPIDELKAARERRRSS